MRRYFGLILLISLALGVLLPLDLGDWLTPVIWTELFVLMFFSYFHVNWEAKGLWQQSKLASLFIAARFLLLPIASYLLLNPWSNFYAISLFLLFLLPAGVTSPALTNLFGGKIESSMIVVVLTSMLSPFAFPLISQWMLGSQLEIQVLDMLQTLLITIVAPYFLYRLLRKRPIVVDFVFKQTTLVNVVFMSFMAYVITSRNQSLILAQPLELAHHTLVLVIAYGLMYLLPWTLFPRQGTGLKKGFSVASGANNIAIGIALGFTYFTPEIGFFFVAGVIIWTTILIPIERIMCRII